METWSRKQIRGADYNPRTIDPTARDRLLENVRRRGLMGPALIVNRSTGVLVSGHQRLAVLDTLEGRDDYSLDITVVELTEAEEREQNVFLNNPRAQGDYDLDVLHDLLAAGDVDIAATGFDVTELAVLFDDLDFGLPAPTPAAEAIAAEAAKVEATTKKARDTMAGARGDVARNAEERDQREHYVVFVYRTDAAVEEVLGRLGLNADARYHDGGVLDQLLDRAGR